MDEGLKVCELAEEDVVEALVSKGCAVEVDLTRVALLGDVMANGGDAAGGAAVEIRTGGIGIAEEAEGVGDAEEIGGVDGFDKALDEGLAGGG